MPKKSTGKRKETASIDLGKQTKKFVAMKKAQIDMTHIPESLKREGYDSEFLKSETIPDYLKCPSCKELFVNPEMYSCGHSICSICLQSRNSDSCPVCKALCYRRIPNYIVKELLEREYPEEQEKRNKELEELKTLKDKLQLYQRSSRFMKILKAFHEYLASVYYAHYKTVMSHLISNTKDLSPLVTEEEVIYCLGCILRFQSSLGVVGGYIINRTSVEDFATWLDNNIKKKGVTEIKKWIPIILLCLTQRANVHETYKKLAKIYKTEIGDELPLEEWRGRPPFWLKDIELDGNIESNWLLFNSFGEHGFGEDLDSSSFSESEDDSENDYFW